MPRRKTRSSSRTFYSGPEHPRYQPLPSTPRNRKLNPRPADVNIYLEGDKERKFCVICARELRKEGTLLEVQRAAKGKCERCPKTPESQEDQSQEAPRLPVEPQTMEEILAKAKPLIHNIGVGNVEQLKLF